MGQTVRGVPMLRHAQNVQDNSLLTRMVIVLHVLITVMCALIVLHARYVWLPILLMTGIVCLVLVTVSTVLQLPHVRNVLLVTIYLIQISV